jgi:hypothetical protein
LIVPHHAGRRFAAKQGDVIEAVIKLNRLAWRTCGTPVHQIVEVSDAKHPVAHLNPQPEFEVVLFDDGFLRVTPVHVHQEPTWSARAHTNYSAFDRLRRNQIGVKKLPLEIVITLSNGSRGER